MLNHGAPIFQYEGILAKARSLIARSACNQVDRSGAACHDNATYERRQAASERAMRRRDSNFSVSEREQFRAMLIRRDGSVCFYCRTKLGCDYHIDHKTPVIKGGADRDLENLALACMQCNQEKHNKDLDEYRAWRRKNRLDVLF